ncbi:hypothetical protein [Nitrosomonas sp.]|uniref:hypothetical protein n=1 Tax=Nitrosomonas sp. TaxID=42353 RepID=UPI0025EB43A7|nr:hypothetical protein [Nitrosomonas sp.]MBY0484969.1 hypothetical protein [Nitrosomonas sp.]
MRINAIFVESISYMPDITTFISDEFDLPDLPNRSAFLEWIINLMRGHEVKNVLVLDMLIVLLAG